MKQNCWEHTGCGRGPGGHLGEELGTCPAATETKLDGVHGGKNAGRACWVVAGTLCEGEVQGTFAKKLVNCMECQFYKLVNEEELQGFIVPIVLLNMMGEYRGPFPKNKTDY